MPQICKICRSPKRSEIEQALLANQPLRNLAKLYGTSPAALHRHKNNDIPAALIQAKAGQVAEYGSGLLKQVQELALQAQRIFKKVSSSKDWRTSLLAIREVRGTLELLGKITGELSPQSTGQPLQPMFFLPVGSHVQVNMGSVSDHVGLSSPQAIEVSVGSGEESVDSGIEQA